MGESPWRFKSSHGHQSYAQVVECIHTILRRWRSRGHAGSNPALGTINKIMKLRDLLEDADDEMIARIKAMARRDVVPIFDPRPSEIRKPMRAYLSKEGRIVAAWPRDSMITHAEMGDYHGGRMSTISPLARNINNCVTVRPPDARYGEKGLMVKNDNHADNRWMPIDAYFSRYGTSMASYRSLGEPA